jgi:hypothetical protein
MIDRCRLDARGVNLFFLQRGPELPDPTSILRGSGKVVRNIALSSPDDLDRHESAHSSMPRSSSPPYRWVHPTDGS